MRLFLLMGTLFCTLAFVYSLLGIVMAGWISAVPGNSPEHVRFNFAFWISSAVIALLLSLCGVFHLMGRSNT